MDWIVGLILVAAGVALLRYRYQVHNFVGEWDWAQKFLGANGTVVALSLIGAGLIFVGVAFPFGAFDKPPVSTTGSGTTQGINYFNR